MGSEQADFEQQANADAPEDDEDEQGALPLPAAAMPADIPPDEGDEDAVAQGNALPASHQAEPVG
jgi:hypothetical protein